MADQPRHYKVLEMRAKDVRRIRAIDVTPNPSGVSIIAGKNGQGKTSTLDSFRMAIAGGSASYAKAIRDGQDRLETWINCGDFEVKRTVTRDGAQELHVRAADGAPVKRPQEFLKGICGDLQFDPLGFSRLAARERRERLLVLTGLGPTVADLDRQRLVSEEKRKESGRITREREVILDTLGDCASFPITPIDTTEISNKSKRNEDRAKTIEAAANGVHELQEAIESCANEIAKRQAEIAQLRERKVIQERDLATAKRDAEQVNASPVFDIAQELESVNAHNAKFAQRKRWEDARLDLEAAVSNYRHHDTTMKTIDQLKAEALESAQMPIEGLGFDGQDVTFGGRPFSELSASETLKVSLSIAMAANPSFRMIFIEDGSLLDEDNLKLIDDLGVAQDFQIVIECVGDREDALIVIEDGAVKERTS